MAVATEIKGALTEALKPKIHPYEMSESEYVDSRVASEIRQYERAITSEKQYLDQIKDKVRPKEKEKLQWKIEMWGKQLARLKAGEWKKVNANYLHEQYAKMLKKAISTGQQVPQSIINQAPEYKAAQTARERYEKGWKTSFANRSVAINEQMKEELGYKVKRQDGKPITSGQLDEIAKGVGDVEDALGPLHDLFDQTDITIVHTSGKHPFLSGVGGTYTPSEKAVNIGVSRVKALGHELGHWLDHESGRVEHLTTRLWAKTGHKAIESTSTAEARETRYKDAQITPLGHLIQDATYNINNLREVREFMKADYAKGLSDEEKEHMKLVRERLSPYWREPREVWARLVEQYIATKNGKGGIATDAPAFYEKTPGWWTKEDFAKLMPQVESLIKARTRVLRGSDVAPPRKRATAEKKLEQFADEVEQIEKTTPVKGVSKPEVMEHRTLGGGNVPDVGSKDKPVLSPYGLQTYRKDGFWYYRGYSMSGSGELGDWMRVTDPRSQGQYDALYTDKESIVKAQAEVEKRSPMTKPKAEGEAIKPGDVITDGLVNARVISEGTMGRHNVPAYKVVITSGHEAGQVSVIPKDQAQLIRHEPAREPKPTAKEPWQMTADEIGKQYGLPSDEQGRYIDPMRHYSLWHEKQIAKALSEGKPVPAEVLKDYPELGKRVEPSGIEVGDFIQRKGEIGKGLHAPRGFVVGEGTIGKNIPAWKIRQATGTITAIAKDEAIAVGKPPAPIKPAKPVSQIRSDPKAETKPKKESRREISMFTPKPTKQSDRAMAIDRALLASQVVSVDDPRWLKQPNRYDVRGVDTPGSGRVTSRTGFTDKGKARLSRRHHRGWKKIKLT